jgi:hypothetical protein
VLIISNRSDRVLGTAIRSALEHDPPPLEVLVLANGAEIDTDPAWGGDEVPVRLIHSSADRGVAGGRNAVAAHAAGEMLLFLDDDAILRPGALESALGAMSAWPRAGAVACQIIDPDSGRPALWFHPRAAERWSVRRFEVANVIGAGFLVRAGLFRALGGFWEGYVREIEEIDLSWRLLDLGAAIVHEPGAVVVHPERSERHLEHSVASNLLMVWRLLPVGLAVRQTLIKLGVFAVRAVRHRELGPLAAGVARFRAGLRRALTGRRTLAPDTVDYLRRVHAPQGPGKRLQWSLRRLPPPEPAGGQPASLRG